MSNVKNLDKIVLAVCLGGLLLAVLIALAGHIVGRDLRGPAFLLFAGALVAAIVMGVMSRQSHMGKAAAITSSVLLVGSLLTMA